MTSPSHDHLLGFLVGALEPCEHEQLEREIAANPELTAELEAIASRLQPLEAARQAHASPPGLAARTCSYVFENTSGEPLATPARRGLAAAMSPDYAGAGHYSRWSMADFVVAAGIFLAAGMLFFPAIASSRYYAQMAQCQQNLRQYYAALGDFHAVHGNDDMPLQLVSNTGGNRTNPRAFSGAAVSVLHDEGFLAPEVRMFCPGAPDAREWSRQPRPTAAEIARAEESELVDLHRRAVGNYAHALGWIEGEQPTCCKTKCNSQRYAIAADAPDGMHPSKHHDGAGQNVLFYDGNIRYVKDCGLKSCGDEFFCNQNGDIAPGVGPHDIVLAPSGTIVRMVGNTNGGR